MTTNAQPTWEEIRKAPSFSESMRLTNERFMIGEIPPQGGALDGIAPIWTKENIKDGVVAAIPGALAMCAGALSLYSGHFVAGTMLGGFGLAGGIALVNAVATRHARGGYLLKQPHIEEVTPAPMPADMDDGNGKWWGQDVQDALDAFEIKATVVSKDDTGATVDVYGLSVSKGFDINKVTTIGANFSRALCLPRGKRVSIDANAGGGLAALYVPKKKERDIRVSDLLKQAANSGATIPGLIGESSTGETLIVDISKAPHMYVAGETGSGKSVMIVCLALSAAYSLSPDKLHITCIDPKRVDLSLLNGLPHMAEKAITDMHKALARLQMMKLMMEQRYTEMEKAGVRNLAAFNKKHPERAMPYHLLVIEELTLATGNTSPLDEDDKTPVGKAIENTLVELAIAARAAGIFMVLGVQRFDAKTFDGQLRQNVPSVIGMKVKARASSDMIIGQSGCETLDGNGECFVLMSGQNSPTRAQGAFATEDEIKGLVSSINKKWAVRNAA